MSVFDDLLEEVKRVEALHNRALTPKEIETIKAGIFLRKIAPWAFDEEHGDAHGRLDPH